MALLLDVGLPLLAVGAHAAYVGAAYRSIVGRDDPLAGMSPLPSLIGGGLYLIAVQLGMRVMRSRPALEPTAAMQIYNVYEAALSALMVALFAAEAAALGGPVALFTAPVDRSARGSRLAFALWLSYASKATEFADTLWMVLRKKERQVTALHLIHHAEMGFLMWTYLRWAPGGTSAFGPAINAGVHVVMYVYYLLTGMGMKPAWKQALTVMQLAQFCVILAHAVYHIATWNKYWVGGLAVRCERAWGVRRRGRGSEPVVMRTHVPEAASNFDGKR